MSKLLYFSLFSLTFISCSFPDEEDIYDHKIKVGYVYCSDGSTLHPDFFKDSNKKAIGVVFWINSNFKANDDLAYAVSLEDLENDFLINSDENIDNVTEDENDFNGASNTAGYLAIGIKDSLKKIPAIEKVVKYAPENVTGWFVPSAGQAKTISNNIEAVYETFTKLNAQKFNDWYWTSTEDGNGEKSPDYFSLIISLNKGRVTNSRKSNVYKIRPIIAIR